ncbi:hypothetical protein GOODEAATRI_016350 [Goodea atripinnis]|uniref:Uncharacterized protein n=1 Tax=Goodea atripinnis TaxID=208336 RepID=A0ABV0MIB1_9TELE
MDENWSLHEHLLLQLICVISRVQIINSLLLLNTITGIIVRQLLPCDVTLGAEIISFTKPCIAFLLAILHNTVIQEAFWRPVETQAAGMPWSRKMTVWKASNTITPGNDGSLGFVLFIM